jgi:hypothetical protein
VAPRQSDQHTAIGSSTFNFPHNTELYTFCDGQHTCAHTIMPASYLRIQVHARTTVRSRSDAVVNAADACQVE